ncbi:aminotransferase, partial [Klebsiella pneumoniae]|uniref:hypothetical protein n=1 Tax=Klebsiella pneumoniae TaxID=573 RepID=UPI000FF141C0
AFHGIRPLDEDAIDALWPLVALRGVVLVLSGRQQFRLDAENPYADAAPEREFRILEQPASIPLEVMGEITRRALGFASRAHPVWDKAPLLRNLGATVVLDAATTSPLNDEGRWLHPNTLTDAALAALNAGASSVVAPAWSAQLTGAPSRTPSAPATVPTALTL